MLDPATRIKDPGVLDSGYQIQDPGYVNGTLVSVNGSFMDYKMHTPLCIKQDELYMGHNMAIYRPIHCYIRLYASIHGDI